ncbi:hypothetical protein PUN28_012415 [Cardiocondyla obscurior]
MIGAYTMSISILLINVLVSIFFSRNDDDEFFEAAKTWAILGVNWMQALRYTQLQKKAQTALICFLIYAVSFLLASAYLASGSISRRHTSAVPWMYLQMISVIDQTVALCNFIVHNQQTNLYLWYSLICNISLIVSVYFWMVVEEARNQWYDEQNQNPHCETNALDFVSIPNSGQKSPSFISQNFSMFESARPPPILPK